MVVNGLSALKGGGQTYILNLLRCIKDNSIDESIIILANTKNFDLFNKEKSMNVRVYEAKFASINIIYRTLWEFFILPFWLFNNNVKHYYAPGGIMISFMPKGCKSFTALRNMLPFERNERQRFPLFSYIRFKLWLLRFVFLLSYKMSDGVIFISNYSRDVIEKYIPDIKDKSIVIYHGISKDFRGKSENPELPNIYGLSSGQYYLYVSTLIAYKGQKELIETWRLLNRQGFKFPLVLVGSSSGEYGEEIKRIVKADKSGLIRYIGHVDYESLPKLYLNARALVFASSCECCPNILLEKLSSNKPVFSSSIQPMPEFGGDSVIYFNPYDPISLANKIVSFESDSSNLIKYANLALHRSKLFDWKKTTYATLSFIKEKS